MLCWDSTNTSIAADDYLSINSFVIAGDGFIRGSRVKGLLIG